MKTYLLLPQMKIQDANAMSSIYTIGFPAMTAWLGAVHALERKITGAPGLEHIRFTGTAVSCHSCDLQVYRGQGDYRNSIIGTANPLRKKGANFERPPFIEEARIHLSVSLLIEVKNHKGVDDEKLIKRLDGAVYGMKWVSGDLIRCGQLKLLRAEEGDEKDERAVLRTLMPGYVLIERRDLMERAMKNGENGLDALLHLVSAHYSARRDEAGKVIGWNSWRKEPGWLVPIAVGFKGLAPLGHVKKQRDLKTPHRFAESVLTLGEFRLPIRFRCIDEILWHYTYQEKSALYLCENQKMEEN